MKSFEQQIREHIEFLQGLGFQISELKFSSNGVRCLEVGQKEDERPKLWHATSVVPMRTGTGIVTNCRGAGGERQLFKTFGAADNGNYSPLKEDLPKERVSSARSPSYKPRQIFEHLPREVARPSKYLQEKNVKNYGLRYSVSHKYGVVAVMPVRNVGNEIIQLQYLNEDGTKRFMTGLSTKGGMHFLKSPLNAAIVAIAEGYATAATLQSVVESLGLNCSVVCALDKSNMRTVTNILEGEFKGTKFLIVHDIDDVPSKPYYGKPGTGHLWPVFNVEGKSHSDFNDLERVEGVVEVTRQIAKGILSLA